MAECAITIMHPAESKKRNFERFISKEMKVMQTAKGMLGGLLVRHEGRPATYLTITFWKSRRDGYSFMQKSKLRERSRPYLVQKTRTRWYQTLARAQRKRFKRLRA